jgi:hypothetical protein
MGGVSSQASSIVGVPYDGVARFAPAYLRLSAYLFHNVSSGRSSSKRARVLSSGELGYRPPVRLAAIFGSLRFPN